MSKIINNYHFISDTIIPDQDRAVEIPQTSLMHSNSHSSSFSSESTTSGYKSSYYYKIYRKDHDTSSYITAGVPEKQEVVKEEVESEDLVDWNEEFQQLIEIISSKNSNQDTLKASYIMLSRLMHDFVHVCKTYAKILVREKSLSLNRKTIKPADVGGYAGGLKYLHAGIMFKFASYDSYGLYGSDEKASKAALLELKALREVFECRAGLSVPLLTVIDYCGHRILCSSILPLDHLVYGSCNGGKTVFANNIQFNEKIELIASKLNLKGHYAGVSPNRNEHVYIHAPCDIEGHLGIDGRMYVLDLHRLFPPEAPTTSNSTEFLYRLLRPEFVKRYPKPLCSDAFSKFTTIDSDIHNSEIRAATETLKQKVIPQLARFLDSLESSDHSNSHNIRISELLHRHGINLRHLGLVRSFTTKPGIRKTILMEMIARSCKNELNGLLRHAVSISKHPSNNPYKMVIVSYFNKILSHDEQFWCSHVKKLLEDYFSGGLSPAEQHRSFSLRNEILSPSSTYFFMRMQQLTGCKLSDKVESQLDTPQFELVVFDIQKLSTKVHSPDFITSIEGMTLYIQSTRTTGFQSDRLFQMAMSKLEEVQSAAPGSTDAASLYGNALIEKSKLKTGEERTNLIKRAFGHYLSISDHDRLFYFAKQLHQLSIDEHHSNEREKLFHLSSEAYKLALDVKKKMKAIQTNINKRAQTVETSTKNEATPPNNQLNGVKGKDKDAGKKKVSPNQNSTNTSNAQISSQNPRKFGDLLPVNTSDTRSRNLVKPVVVKMSSSVAAVSTKMNSSTANSSIVTPPKPSSTISPVISPSCPGDPEYYLNWGDLVYDFAKSRGGSSAKDYFAEAGRKYELSWHEDPNMLLMRAAEYDRQEVISRMIESCISDGATADLASIIAYVDSSPHLNSIDSKECPSLTDSVINRIARFQRIPPQLLRLDAVPPSLVNQGFEVTTLRLSGPDISNDAFKSPFPYLLHLEIKDCHKFSDLGLVWMSRFSSTLESLNLSKCVVGNQRMSKSILIQQSSALPASLSLFFESQISSQLNDNLERTKIDENKTKIDENKTKIDENKTMTASKAASSKPGSSQIPSTSNTTLNSTSNKLISSPTKKTTQSSYSELQIKDNSSSNPISSSLSSLDQVFVLSELHQMPNLTNLNLSDCFSLTDLGLYFFVRKSPNLTSLNISGCTGITTTGLINIFQKRKTKPSVKSSTFENNNTPSNNRLSRSGSRDSVVSKGSGVMTPRSSSRLLAFQAERKKFLEQQRRQLAESADSNSASFFLWSEISPNASNPSSSPSSATSSQASSPVSSRSSSPTRFSNKDSSNQNQSNPTLTNNDTKDPPPEPMNLQLTSLDLSGCVRLEDEAIFWASLACPLLAKVKLAKLPQLTSKSVLYLVRKCPIKSLKLGKFPELTDSIVNEIAANCPDLEQFEVTSAKKISVPCLNNLLRSCPLISILSLSHMPQIDDSVILTISNHLKGLKILKMSSLYKVTPGTFAELGAKQGHTLQVLNIDACEKVNDQAIINVVSVSSALKILSLRDCKSITPSGIVSALAHCSQLQSLTLGKHSLQPITIKQLSDALVQASQISVSATSQFSISTPSPLSPPQPLPALQSSICNLTSLDLSWCKFAVDGSLEPLFKVCPYLINVDFNESKIGDKTLNLLAKHCHRLESVNLSSTKISDEGVLNLLSSCGHTLRNLKLAGCWKLSDIVVNKLADSAPGLKVLNIGWVTKITQVRPLFSHCHNLNCLVLDGLGTLKDDIIYPLVQNSDILPNLCILALSGCSEISSSAIFQLRMARPGCSINHTV